MYKEGFTSIDLSFAELDPRLGPRAGELDGIIKKIEESYVNQLTISIGFQGWLNYKFYPAMQTLFLQTGGNAAPHGCEIYRHQL